MAYRGMKKREFMTALLTARTVKDAALAVGIGERTAYHWMAKNSTFRAELSRLQDAQLGQVTRLTVAAMTDAVETLRGIMNDRETPATARVAAARSILECGVKFAELLDLAQRVAEIEKGWRQAHEYQG